MHGAGCTYTKPVDLGDGSLLDAAGRRASWGAPPVDEDGSARVSKVERH